MHIYVIWLATHDATLILPRVPLVGEEVRAEFSISLYNTCILCPIAFDTHL